ncbi:hypothetical protein, partial [Gordonia westfalica]|uniref:hypothetical protein n=1 Tax=Gordonia westfalica TaxID=158898 RepID=UPI001AD81233
DPDLLEDTHKQVRELTGADNRAAHDYQKLLLVRDHGEIGPVLTCGPELQSRLELPSHTSAGILSAATAHHPTKRQEQHARGNCCRRNG